VIKPEFAPYRLEIEPQAIEDLAKFSSEDAENIIQTLVRIAETGAGNVEWLEGYQLVRLKAPPARALADVGNGVIVVVLIEFRDKVYSKKSLRRVKKYHR
jgi:mRNA-degrading endonuclease RelE of RelBE toxin-antitoxin system